jgi:predicted nucleic acid-binding protein
MQTQYIHIALTSYIYIYIAIYLCIATKLTCQLLSRNDEKHYEIKQTKLSTWDLYNLKKQKFR